MTTKRCIGVLLAGIWAVATAVAMGALPGSQPLQEEGDLSLRMRAGIDAYLTRELDGSVAQRAQRWHRDFSSAEAYEKSVASNRERLRQCTGIVDTPVSDSMLEAVIPLAGPDDAPDAGRLRNAGAFTVTAVRWAVLDGVSGEGLLLCPKQPPKAYVIAIPDADQTPEMLAGVQPGVASESQFARRLAAAGCEVLVPVLVNRDDTFSGNPAVKRLPNQPHREWIYRQSFEMGRHPIGYEVEKILAAVDCLAKRRGASPAKIGVIGYGEGGLLALYCAALRHEIAATVVSGYFGPRERIWEEPIYRNVFGLLREFGDAEVASLIAPRRLIVEYSAVPTLRTLPENAVATPGRLVTPPLAAVEAEVQRANVFLAALRGAPRVALVKGSDARPLSVGSKVTLDQFLDALATRTTASEPGPTSSSVAFTASEQLAARQCRQVRELERYTQRLFHASEQVRNALTLDRLDGKSGAPLEILNQNRERFWTEVIGRIERPRVPLNTRSRQILDQPKWIGHEVMLDVLPDVFAWGYLLVPKDLRPGERRPVVVCVHGLEGQPASTVGKIVDGKFTPSFGAQLADRGFIVFSPHIPFRGRDAFRMLQRKANPLGLSLFSFAIAQTEAELDWLETLPFVDPARIGFYGISYGGKAAMRIPPVLTRFAATVCAADFNDWIAKNTTIDSAYSYVFKNEWELPEWNLGHTFNHAELAALIAPRPFMVERGHDDPVAPDSWVASEFAKVKRIYAKRGVPEQAEIEFFDGGHRVNGVGSFKFLHRHLNWPEPTP